MSVVKSIVFFSIEGRARITRILVSRRNINSFSYHFKSVIDFQKYQNTTKVFFVGDKIVNSYT